MMSYNLYVTFYCGIENSIVNTYMLIEKRQVQPKGPEPATQVYKEISIGSKVKSELK